MGHILGSACVRKMKFFETGSISLHYSHTLFEKDHSLWVDISQNVSKEALLLGHSDMEMGFANSLRTSV